MEHYARLGLMGKHPGYGDFLRAGLSEAVSEAIERWLDATLPQVRDDMGNDFAGFWDGAQDVRFWIGRAIFGHTLIGVLRPWRDRAGRRYPFILAVEGADVQSPMVDPDQTIWNRLSEHIDNMEAGEGGIALLENLHLIVPAETEEMRQLGPVIWAHHPEGDLAALLSSAAPVDTDRARLNRSYWWAPATMGRAATWLGCPGLPEPQSLTWLLGGVPIAINDKVNE